MHFLKNAGFLSNVLLMNMLSKFVDSENIIFVPFGDGMILCHELAKKKVMAESSVHPDNLSKFPCNDICAFWLLPALP